MAKTLHLLIPGLLETARFDSPAPPIPVATLPALRWLLARADPHPAPATTDELLLSLFKLTIPADADLPVAALTRLADGGAWDAGWWLRADPVHLRPDLRGVFLADAGRWRLNRLRRKRWRRRLTRPSPKIGYALTRCIPTVGICG